MESAKVIAQTRLMASSRCGAIKLERFAAMKSTLEGCI